MSVFLSMNHPAVAEITLGLLENGCPVKYIETGYTERISLFKELPPVIVCTPPEFLSQGKLEQELWCGEGIWVLDTRMLRFSQNIAALNGKVKEEFDENILDLYKQCERDYLCVSDRLSYSSLTVREKMFYYRSLVFYWHAFFRDKKDIDAVLFRETPHAGYDMVMYYAAKLNGKQVWYPEQCRIGVFYLFRNDNRPDKKVPLEYQAHNSISDIKAHLSSDYRKKVELFNNEYRREFTISTPAPLKLRQLNLMRLIKRGTSVIGGFGKAIKLLRKKRALSITDYRGGEKPIIYYKYLIAKNRHYVRKLRAAYEKLAEKADLSRSYVLLVLHMQPERTSSPLVAGIFEDQLNMLNLLLGTVPNDWLIYIKEHPHTFKCDLGANDDFSMMHSIAQRNYRSADDYQSMAVHKNVRIINLDEDIHSLVAHARATVTINGTVGWLSLLDGKPVISFGTPWYSSCNSCYCVRDREQLKAALADIENKSIKQVHKDMWRFWSYQESRLVDLGQFNLGEYTEKERLLLGRKAALGIAKIIAGGKSADTANKLKLVYSHQTSSKVKGL